MGLRKRGGQLGGLLGRDARGQRIDPRGQQTVEDLFQRRNGFALAKYDLGIATAATSIEVDLRLVQIGRGRLGGDRQKLIERQRPVEKLPSQFFQTQLVHKSYPNPTRIDSRLDAARPIRDLPAPRRPQASSLQPHPSPIHLP